MRLFLVLFVADMLGRSLISVTPFADEWGDELGIDDVPKLVPRDRDSLRSRVSSLAAFFDPRSAGNSAKVDARARQRLKTIVTWAGFRLAFVEGLVGIDQDWPMFSPDIATESRHGRFELLYRDGTQLEVRSSTDPEDLTDFTRFLDEKRLQASEAAISDADALLGYCNMLSHRHPKSPSGAVLEYIVVSIVEYAHPPPGVEPGEFLEAQNDPANQRIDRDLWYFDASTGQGRLLIGQSGESGESRAGI